MRSFRLTIAYDGTEFSGWQFQPYRRTVQGLLEVALQRLTGESLRVVASGRTDAGVHALGQVVSFDSATRLAPEVLQRALNATLPPDVVVLDAAEAPAGFHAIRHTIGKRYRYVVYNCPQRDVFDRHHVWHVPQRLNVNAMRTALTHLVGRHDFAAFQASGAERKSTVRTVRELSLIEQPGPAAPAGVRLIFEIEADGFLYNMVRNIVGTVVEVGRGFQPPDWVASVLASCDRKQAGPTAPPHGLFLVHVDTCDPSPPEAPHSTTATTGANFPIS